MVASMLVAGLMMCAAKREDLTEAEQDHIHALEVWMEPKQIKGWYKLKTVAERDQALKDAGLWDRFYSYDAELRAAIIAGEVRTGWTGDRVYMAWGPPHQKKRLTGRNAGRSEGLVYRFEVAGDGSVMVWAPGSKETYGAVGKYTMEVVLDDNVVAEMNKKDGW